MEGKIFVYNTLTRKKEEFVPLDREAKRVNIYVCGITAYDFCHLGHGRSLYIFEVIRRYLTYRGYKVFFVRNITDIDDKIINRARQLNVPWQDLAAKYIEAYSQDLRSLGLPKADIEPLATENIPDIQRYIQALLDKGFAYPTKSGVYFRIRHFPDYGRLSGQSIQEMLKGVRIEIDESKEDPLDFALWKVSEDDEPGWESPWGRGRPGWHIECSVMSQKFLNTPTLDIHAGGRDLIFPHHENEIAQSEALSQRPLAKYWMHHGLLTIRGQKMAKSLGNFISIRDFMEKYQDADCLKLFYLGTHYAHPADYSEEKIEEAKKAQQRILIFLDEAERRLCGYREKENIPLEDILKIKQEFLESMDDDFNTPQALAALFKLINTANKRIKELAFLSSARRLLSEFMEIFALKGAASICGSISSASFIFSPEEINCKIKEREKARKDKDYALADRIRKELEERGIILEDLEDGTTRWRRRR